MCGEGGMLVINDERFLKRAEVIREKGTNRSAFFRGEIDKYCWVDIGSSFLPSDILAAFLFAQIENLDEIQTKRKEIWNQYFAELKVLENEGIIKLSFIPGFAFNNAHMFYIVCKDLAQRTDLINHLSKANINAVFHYQSLHKSKFYSSLHDGRQLPEADRYSDCLLRLPMYYELSKEDVSKIANCIKDFYELPYNG